ncbi:MAG: hypothetical protein WA687_03025 [Solirubrobacterales bacterium]
MKQIRKRLTYANVMSSLAVFLILGGATAFAAVKKVGPNEIKANSIKTGKIVKEAVTAGKIKKAAVNESRLADGAVTTNKLADNAVTTPKIAADAVTTAKIAKEAVTNEKIAANAVTDANIANGAISANKLGAITVQTETATVATGGDGSANVECPAGQRAISGGGAWDIFAANLSFLSTRPIRSVLDNGQMADGEVALGWRASGHNASGSPVDILVWVLCAS